LGFFFAKGAGAGSGFGFSLTSGTVSIIGSFLGTAPFFLLSISALALDNASRLSLALARRDQKLKWKERL
jgi:uncharacterized membrane protein YbaN (DUF454 family)